MRYLSLFSGIEADVLLDFRTLSCPDGAFKLVCFDPPHLLHARSCSWMAARYGKLSGNWRDDLRAGFAEFFRVLDADGVLVFKWNETRVPSTDVLAFAFKTIWSAMDPYGGEP